MALALGRFLFEGPPNGVPHRGQKEACTTSGVLQRGQELVIGDEDGEEGPGTGVVSMSGVLVAAVPCAAKSVSYNIGKSGCVL